ncbi:hypothetical protein K491DRAFT_386290 [Lophiostoma macrostomum CBS 122681]|uniref:Zn(2)-C6 fungal-type domain-containing protein n=1 Tax=Lophiostoma macrostomum CBS 122681 TaxID=1314788 RepID=A0A6A6TRK6_9PLEO|nr:hypothetical protein K491DRAFT_386290 [Lophiostoma macrostomum CBS 122681]
MPRPNLGMKTFHSKSRNGCKRCKERRVKCNLQGPVCSNCSRRSEVCEFSATSGTSPGLPLVTGSPVRLNPTARSVGLLRRDVSVPSPLRAHPVLVDSFEIVMSSCLRQTIWIHGIIGNETNLWRDVLSPHMAECYYLQHGLSSLLSLHEALKCRHGAAQAQTTAYQHHLIASRLFRNSINMINERNWVTVLLFSISVIVFHFGSHQICSDDTFDYMETFHVLRMSLGAVRALSPFLSKSHFWPHIRFRVEQAPRPFDHEAQLAIEELGSLVASLPDVTCDNRNVQMRGFEGFKTWAYNCASCPRAWKHYIEWPGTVSSAFVQLLSEGDDIATLILIYWCAFMHRSPSRWFLESWPRRTAASAMRKLTENWTEILTWPASVLLLPNGNDASSGELFDYWPDTLQAIGF